MPFTNSANTSGHSAIPESLITTTNAPDVLHSDLLHDKSNRNSVEADKAQQQLNIDNQQIPSNTLYKLDNSGPPEYFEAKKPSSDEPGRTEESQADVKARIETSSSSQTAVMIDLNNNNNSNNNETNQLSTEGKQSANSKELDGAEMALKLEKVENSETDGAGVPSQTNTDSLVKESEKTETGHKPATGFVRV